MDPTVNRRPGTPGPPGGVGAPLGSPPAPCTCDCAGLDVQTRREEGAGLTRSAPRGWSSALGLSVPRSPPTGGGRSPTEANPAAAAPLSPGSSARPRGRGLHAQPSAGLGTVGNSARGGTTSGSGRHCCRGRAARKLPRKISVRAAGPRCCGRRPEEGRRARTALRRQRRRPRRPARRRWTPRERRGRRVAPLSGSLPGLAARGGGR